jgi:hypothetical protein
MIKVAGNGHDLVRENGAPFVWIGDTAWEACHRLNDEDARFYLETRAHQGFNVVQVVLLAEFDGMNTANAFGECPLFGNDPAKPNPAYFDFVDRFVELAAEHGIVVGLLPTWGDKVARGMWGVGPLVFDPPKARAYGEWLGRRYRDAANLVWILGGDRPPVHGEYDDRDVWRALAAGLDTGGGCHRVTGYHPAGRSSSEPVLHGEPWLDLNMQQSGHGDGRDSPLAWSGIEQAWGRAPAKPVLDAEINYEDHPVNPWPKFDPTNGHFTDYDIRKQSYRSIFAGACGVTYGHHSVWQFCDAKHPAINHALMDWRTALTRPGARQMSHLRSLLETPAFVGRTPCQELIVSARGERGTHVRAMRGDGDACAWVYTPVPAHFTLDLSPLDGGTYDACWFDPRTGSRRPVRRVSRGVCAFVPPEDGGADWVLELRCATMA